MCEATANRRFPRANQRLASKSGRLPWPGTHDLLDIYKNYGALHTHGSNHSTYPEPIYLDWNPKGSLAKHRWVPPVMPHVFREPHPISCTRRHQKKTGWAEKGLRSHFLGGTPRMRSPAHSEPILVLEIRGSCCPFSSTPRS